MPCGPVESQFSSSSVVELDSSGKSVFGVADCENAARLIRAISSPKEPVVGVCSLDTDVS